MANGTVTDDARGRRRGFLHAFAAYGLWGLLPVYFLLLKPSGPFEVVAWRILFSLVFCAVLITVTRAWPAFLALLRRPRIVFAMGLAGAFIFVNWQTYVFATLSGHVVDASLGYFINPIVTILLGVVVRRERLRPVQWASVGLGAVAVVVLAVAYGGLPWIALVLAASFGLYGLIKKQVGGSVDALSGLTLETLWLSPVAIVELVIVGSTTGLTLGTAGVGHTIALLSAGIVTAVPLLLFASASRQLPLVHMGLIQYIAPVMQFLVGVVLLGEHMSTSRWIGFGLVWLALIMLTADMVRHSRSARRAYVELS